MAREVLEEEAEASQPVPLTSQSAPAAPPPVDPTMFTQAKRQRRNAIRPNSAQFHQLQDLSLALQMERTSVGSGAGINTSTLSSRRLPPTPAASGEAATAAASAPRPPASASNNALGTLGGALRDGGGEDTASVGARRGRGREGREEREREGERDGGKLISQVPL
jgi:hypothetical protein